METRQGAIVLAYNLHRENLKPSEKAFAYRLKLSAMKHQGKRTDMNLTTSVQVEPKLKEDDISGTDEMSLRSNEILARQTGETVAQIKRYIRLTYLIPKILEMVDNRKIAFSIAIEISYLKIEEQYELYAVMDLEQCTPSLSQANRMKRMSREGKLDIDSIYSIMEEQKPNQREQIKIKAEELAEYLPKDLTPKQKAELIIELVKEWHRNNHDEHLTR